MEKQLAIVTEDAAYGRTLADYMSSSHVFDCRINVFYDAADYLLFHDETRVEVLLIDERLAGLLPEEDEKYRLVLSEHRSENPKNVFMYQALDVIVKEVYYKIHDNRPLAGETHTLGIFAVLGARGGCGVSTLALCLAKALGRGKRVLFISLDHSIVMPGDLPCEEGALGELLYELRLHRALWINHAEDFVKHGRDFDYICGVHCYEELASFTKEAARDFFAGLSADGRYDCVVFDLGMLPGGAGVVAEKSEKLFLIAAENSPEAKMVKKQLIFAAGEELSERLCVLSMPYDKQFSKGRPEYHDYDNTEMFEFALKLLEKKEDSIAANHAPGKKKNELAVMENEQEYVPVRKRLSRLIERGFSEGFRG